MALFARKDKTPLGIYIHVPFCRSKCQYCDFYSLTTKDDRLMDSFLDAVCAHIKEAGQLAPGYEVDTIETTGAGDTFCACVLHYILTNGFHAYGEYELTQMLTFANAAAAIVTTKKGALAVMPSIEEVEQLIRRNVK